MDILLWALKRMIVGKDIFRLDHGSYLCWQLVPLEIKLNVACPVALRTGALGIYRVLILGG